MFAKTREAPTLTALLASRWERLGTFLESVGQDLFYGLRILRRNPGFTLTAILTLALGMGATTTIFSIIVSVLFHLFPYRNPDRLVTFEVQQATYTGPPDFSIPQFLDVASGSQTFEEFIGFGRDRLPYRNALGLKQQSGAWVTTNAFSVLGVAPLLGRSLLSDDGNPGAPPVCIVSDRLWREEFSEDPNVLGKTIGLGGRLTTIVGVMPAWFQFLGAAVWIPYSLHPGATGGQPARIQAIARLKPDVTLRAATADYDTVARRMVDAYPADFPEKQFTVSVSTIVDNAVGSFRRVLYTLFAAVAMLLLIACTNVANLLLVRATARQKEIAIRAAIGAGRSRLVRQLLVESWLIAAAACIAGCLVAVLGLRMVEVLLPPGKIPSEADIGLNRHSLLFAVVLTAVTAVLCGLAPALRVIRGQERLGLTNTAASRSPGRLRGALVISEIALSVTLLVGAGLMARTFFAITQVDIGFNPANTLHAQLFLPPGRYDSSAQQRALFQDILERIRQVPGVTAAALSLELPPLDGGMMVEVDVPGRVWLKRPTARLQICSETYFQTLGRPLKRGRSFSQAEIHAGRHSAVVNESFVRTFFAHDDAVGRKIKFTFEQVLDAPPDPYFDVIGVVADAKNNGVREPIEPQVYLPFTAYPMPGNGIIVRTAVPPMFLIEIMRRQVWAADPGIVMTGARTLEQAIHDAAYAEPRFTLLSVGGFAGIGLVLVAVGLFSVMAYSVSIQRHEIGIRMALGAAKSQVVGAVIRKGLALIAAGMIIGLLGSLALARVIASQLWGVSATDPWTYSGVAVVVMASGVTACLLPASRAAKVDPVQALRHE
jgi:putative ABC transport system permease protein